MYIDGFVIAVPKKNVPSYKKMATLGKKVWMEHGALQYVEAVGDDLKVPPGCGTGFPKLAKTRAGETVVFAFIAYKSRAHRDAVNKKVMADPRMTQPPKGMPFDIKRMSWGGFDVIVNA